MMMTLVMAALAAAVGVLLAALDSPHAQQNGRAVKFSILLIITGFAAAATAVAQDALG
ncbi:hypothetical protein [Krasilnikovia sp. MM14-A1004]|uniref:hypothetical protein n=1 Tax=Krasilnikovia sp. MM14-A1004 TaxID=3373541 RepID=UPI00399CCC62